MFWKVVLTKTNFKSKHLNECYRAMNFHGCDSGILFYIGESIDPKNSKFYRISQQYYTFSKNNNIELVDLEEFLRFLEKIDNNKCLSQKNL